MHVLSVNDFDQAKLATLFAQAESFRHQLVDPLQRRELATTYQGRQMCSLFYEPSTRTRTSFEKAALNLGLGIVTTENAKDFSSAAKGETIEDTIRVLNQYGFDVIVMRHYETGAAAQAAAVSQTPIINAGDGKGEHPTQSLLDAYTIYQKFGRLDNLRVVIGGDLRHGRTARSLAQLLSTYKNNRLTFVSVPELQIDQTITSVLQQRQTDYNETEDMLSALKDADVVYWTRLQKERLDNPDRVPKDGFVLDNRALRVMPEQAIIMHPLPRIEEITTEVDADERAWYFQQAGNGLLIRMALLDAILSDSFSS